MKQYLDLLSDILANGNRKPDRTGTGTLSLFGRQLRLDLREGFPLLTTKRLPFRHIAEELFWFISGSANVKDLQKHGVTIWDEWARPDGELGPIYSRQWRAWEVPRKPGASGRQEWIDQLATVINQLRTDPHSRRHIVSAWNVADLDKMALPPCHLLYQFDVTGGRLSCQMYQRSADVFLGLPFNIASYALLTHLVAAQVGLAVGELVICIGDAHLYSNHVEQAKLQLTREPRALPWLDVDATVRSIDDYCFEHLLLDGYCPHPHIPAPVAV